MIEDNQFLFLFQILDYAVFSRNWRVGHVNFILSLSTNSELMFLVQIDNKYFVIMVYLNWEGEIVLHLIKVGEFGIFPFGKEFNYFFEGVIFLAYFALETLNWHRVHQVMTVFVFLVQIYPGTDPFTQTLRMNIFCCPLTFAEDEHWIVFCYAFGIAKTAKRVAFDQTFIVCDLPSYFLFFIVVISQIFNPFYFEVTFCDIVEGFPLEEWNFC